MVSQVRYGCLVIRKINEHEFKTWIRLLCLEFGGYEWTIAKPYCELLLHYYYHKNFFVPKIINRTNSIKLTPAECRAFIEYFHNKQHYDSTTIILIRSIYDQIYRNTV